MTLISNLLFILAFVIAQNSALEEINSDVAIKAAKDNPVLLKILQTVDAATSNERLFDVTLKLLKSLCVCMRETIRTKRLEKFQLSREMISLETEDDAREANRKVLDIYLKIYNKTCIDLREELAVKVNTSGCLTPEEENKFLNYSNCGKKAIDENTEDYEKLTSQVTQVVVSEANLKKILHTIFVITRDYHKFHMRKFNLFKNSQKSTQNSVKHSIIVILTFYPQQNSTQPSDNITEVSSNELNTTLYSHSPIDIDVIDTRYGRRENSKDEDFIPKLATNCTLKSIYSFLLQSEEVNKTKVFKMLRKKGTIKVYIDIPTQTNHIDYSKVCCSNETEIPLCKIDFSRESFDSHEITTYLPEFKKRKKLHGDYKDTIYKIKTLVQLYDRKLNKNNFINKSRSDRVAWSKNKILKPPFKANDLHPVAESVILKNYFIKQNATEIFLLLSSFTESKMNTVPENTDSKELIRTTLHDDDKNKLVLQNEDISVTNARQFNHLAKPYTSLKLLTETVLPLENGLEDMIKTRLTHEEDKKTSIFQSYQKPQNSAGDDRLTTAYNYYSNQYTLPTHKNNEFITETEKKMIQTINTTSGNLVTDSSGNTGIHTNIIKDNVNINTNTIDYSDSAKILTRAENYPKQKGYDKNIDDQSVTFKSNNQPSNDVKKQNIGGIFNTEINYIDVTNAMTTNRSGENENYKVTPEKPNNKVGKTPTDINGKFNSPDKYFDMQQNQLKVTGVINKTLDRSHIENNNNLRVKETMNLTTDYSNTSSDMKTLTSSFEPLINNTLNSIKITVKHDDDGGDLQPLVLFDPTNIQSAKLKESTSNEMNLRFSKNELFHNSRTPETTMFGKYIEERSSITGKQDQIKTTKNLAIPEQYNNILSSFETTDEITNTNKRAELSMLDTTEAAINFQVLQSELENTLVTKYERDSFKTMSILSSSTTKPTVSNIKANYNTTKDIDDKYFNPIFVTEEQSERTETNEQIVEKFNATSEKHIETNKFDELLEANENINEVLRDFVNTRIESVGLFNSTSEGFTKIMDYKSKHPTRITNSKNIKIQKWEEINNLNTTKLNNGLKLSKFSEKKSVPEFNENLITTFGLHNTTIENSKGNDNVKKTETRLNEGESLYTTDRYNVTNKNGMTNTYKLTTPNYIWSFDTKSIDNNYDSVAISSLEPQRNPEIKETSSPYFPSIAESLSTVTPPKDIAINVDNNIEQNTLKDEIFQSIEASDISLNTNGVIRTAHNAINKVIFGKAEYFKSGRMRSTNHMQISYKNQSKPYEMSFQSNTKKSRAENGSNVFAANLKGTTEPYSNNKTYVQNVGGALLESVTKNNSHNDTEIYTSATTSTLHNISNNSEEIVQTETKTDLSSSLSSNTKKSNKTDSITLIKTSYEMQNKSPFILMEMTKNNDRKISEDSPTLFKSTAFIQPHGNIDSFSKIAKLKSSTDSSNYSGETENNTEEENKSKNTLETIGLTNKEQLLSFFLTNQSKITAQFSIDKVTTTLSKSIFPKLLESDMIFKPQMDSLPTDTPKFNETTLRPTEILATNNIDHQQISISDNIEQYSSKANKSRITRSTSAMKSLIGTSNQTFTFSTTVPFSDILLISLSTSTLQDPDESNITKTTQLPEVSHNFDLPSVNTEPQFAITVDPSFDETQSGTISLGTEKYPSIPENDEKITTYIISPNVIRDTDTKKSKADLNNLTNLKVLSVSSNEHYDVKSINNNVQAMIPPDQTNINKSQNLVVQQSQPTRNIDTTEINYLKIDNAKNHTEIRDTAALRLTTNVPQIETSEINNISFKATNDGKETKAVKDLEQTNNMKDSEIRSTVADEIFGVSFEPMFEGPFKTQHFKTPNFSDTQNNSRSTSSERTNNGTDSEVPSSLEDIHNVFQTNLNFLDESSQSDQHLTSTIHNVSTTRESQIDDLNITQLQPVSLKYFKENMSKTTTTSSNQHENTNDTLILTKENTNNIYTPYSSLVIDNSYTRSEITKEPKYEETSYHTSAKPRKFYKSEYLFQPVTTLSTLIPGDEQSYIRSITTDKNNFTIIISPEINGSTTKSYSNYTKISSFGENLKVTTPNLIENERNKELISDSNVEFLKENIPLIDAVTSSPKSSEKMSNSKVTKPKMTFKPHLNNLQHKELSKSGENGVTIKTTNLAGENKDFTSFRVITSSKSTKEKKYDRNHVSKVVRITNIAEDKYNDKVHNVEVTTLTPYKTEHNHVPQNKNTKNVQLSYTYNTRFEIAEEHTVIYDNVTFNTVKLDDSFQQETYKGPFESMTDLNNHETLKTINSTKFVDNFETKSRTLPDNKIADYNFTRERLELSSIPERPIFFQHTDTSSTTEDGNGIIFNILNSSTVSYKQYNGNDNRLRVTKISPYYSEYYSQLPKADKSLDYVATHMRDGFEIRKEEIKNKTSILANITYDNMAENEIANDSLKEKLINSLNKSKVSIEFIPTENFKGNHFKNEIFENKLKITEKSTFHATHMNESNKTKLATITKGSHSLPATDFVDKLNEFTRMSNIIKTTKSPERTNNFAVTELSLAAEYDTKTRRPNKMSTIDKVQHENNSFQIKNEIFVNDNSVTSRNSKVAYLINNKNHNFFNVDDEIFNTDKNETYAPKAPMVTGIFINFSANPETGDNKVKITKEANFYEAIPDKVLKTRQFISSENGSNLEILGQTPSYFQLTNTEDKFEDDIISNIKNTSILNQQQIDTFDDMALTESVSSTLDREFYIETQNTRSTPSKDQVKRMNETFKIAKGLTENIEILKPIYVTVGYLTDNKLYEPPSKELFITNIDRPKTLNEFESIKLIDNVNTKSGILNNYFEITEAPSFDVTLTGETLRTRYHNLSRNGTQFSNPNEKQFTNHTTDTPQYTGYGDGAIIFNEEKPSNFTFAHNLTVTDLYSAKYQNGTINTLSTLNDLDAYMTDTFRKRKGTTESHIVVASNDVIVYHLSKNQIPQDEHKNQSLSEQTQVKSNFDTQLEISDKPLEVTKEINVVETQTEEMIKSLTSENHKTLDYFTETTASTKSFRAVKNTEIHDNFYDVKPRSKEKAVYSTNLYTFTTLEDKNDNSIKAHNPAELKNMNEISSFEKIPQFDDKFITMKESDKIKTVATSQNETVNEMTKYEIHEASSNSFLTTDLNETDTHKSQELAVLTNDVGDRPNTTDNYKITTILSFGKLQTESLLPNLKSFQLLTESTRLSKEINYFENTTPTERQFMPANIESINFNEKEHFEKTCNTENTSSPQAPKSKNSERVSYAITESLDVPIKGNNVSINTITHSNNEITSKKKNESSNSIFISSNTLAKKLTENEMHNKFNKALHKTEFTESGTLRDSKSDQKYDYINTRFDMADQNLAGTEITISKYATTVDFRNKDVKIVKKTEDPQEKSTELNFEESSTFPHETYNYNFTEYHNDKLKTRNDTKVNYIIAFNETVLIPKATDSTGIISDLITFTVSPVLNETQRVKILNAEENYSRQNETKFLTPKNIQNFVVLDSLSLNKDDIVKGFNILKNTSNYYDGLSKPNTTKPYDIGSRVKSRVIKESVESSTDRLAIIDIATASFDLLLDDLTFPGVTYIDKVTEVRFSRVNQTSQLTPKGDKSYGHSETATEKSTKTVSPLQDNILQNKTIKIKDDHKIIIQFNATEEPKEKEHDYENSIKSIIKTEQNTATTADSDFIEKGVISPQLSGTLNGLSMTTVNQSTKMHQYESSDILLSSVTSNQLDLSKSSSHQLEFYENTRLKTTPNQILSTKDNEIDGTNIKSYSTAVNAGLDSNLRLINKSTMTMNKNPTTDYALDMNTKPEKKINIDENLITTTTKTVMSEANITTTVNHLKVLELLNKIRSSYYEEPNYLNEVIHSVVNDHFTVTTPLGETDSYLNNTELIHEEPKNEDVNEITYTILHENLPFNTADQKNQLQSKTTYITNMKSTQHNGIDLKDKNYTTNDTEVNTTVTTKYLTSLSGANIRDKNVSEIHRFTYPISLNMLEYNDTEDHFNLFEETTESTLLSMDTITKQTPSNNEYFTFDPAQTIENSNYEKTEKSNTKFEISQESYVSKTNMLNSFPSENVSQSSHLREKTNSPTDLDTVYPQKRNETKVTGHSKNLTEREVTQRVTTYTEQIRGQLQNTAEMNESVTEVESNLITLTPRTTSKYISVGDVITKDRTETTKQLEKNLNYFVTNPTTVPFLKENLKVISHVEGLEGTNVLENEIKVSTVTNRVNSFSTVDDLASSHNKNSATLASAVLINVPPLALHVSDLKFELVPTYGANNTSQLIPNLHGTFNISINLNSQNVTDPMGLNKTLEVFDEPNTFGDQLQPIKLRVNSTSEKSESELNKYKENAYTKVTNHYLPSLTKNKKEFLSNSTSGASESQTLTNILAKNYTLWDDGKNRSIKRTDMSNEFTTPEIEKYSDLVRVTAIGKNTLTVTIKHTNLNSHLRIPPSSLHQDSVTEPYTLHTNFKESNILKDAREFHGITMSDSTNQIEHFNNGFYSNKAETKKNTIDLNHDKINSVNLTRNTATLTTIKNIENGLTNKVNQASPSRRFGNETDNLFLKPNKDVEIAINKYTLKNISDSRRIIDSNIVLTTVESDFSIKDMNTTLRSIYTENNVSDLTTIKDDRKHSSYLVPVISGLSHNTDTVKITKKGNISESTSSNRNNSSSMNVHTKTIAQNFANDKHSSIEPTTSNTVQLLESNPTIISVIDGNKPNSLLVPVIPELLQNVIGMTIVDIGNLSESAIPNQNKSSFVYESHKKDALNSTNAILSSMETTTYKSQPLEPKPKVTNIIDGSKPSSILRYVNTMTSADKINFSESAMPNQNKSLVVSAFSKMDVQTPANKKENPMHATTNISQIMKSISNVTGSKTSSNLFTLISEPLLNATRMTITKKEIFSKSAVLNQNKTLVVNIHNVINIQNYAEMKKDSIKRTSNTSQLPEMISNTSTPIVLNIILIADKINKKNRKRKNAKSKQNKTVKNLKETSTSKVGMATTQNIKLKSEDEKSSNNINRTKNLPNIRKVYEAITADTKQKTDTLNTVNSNVVHTQASQNFNNKDKYNHRKQQNHVPKLFQSIDIKKESNVVNKVAITDKTEHNSDSKLKYESFNSNLQVPVTSKSLFRTTKQIKYNTYRPLSEEELVPSELDKIISAFPKYYTKIKIKNPQQVKNYHDTPYLNNIKYNTKPDLHNTSNIYDPLDKRNTYPIKKIISSPRKVIKRIKLPNKRNEIMTMNTADFFSRRLGVTKNDKIGDILKLYPKPVLQLLPVTTKPRIVVLRPKFNSFNTLTQKPAIKKPMIVQHVDLDYYRNLHRSKPQYQRSGSIWNNVNNNILGNLGTPSLTGFGDPVIETPYYIPTIMKPKFLRDRVNSIRSYIYNADKKPNYRRHFMNEPDEVDDADDSLVTYSKGNSRDEEDTVKPVHRISRPKKTIFFLSPTVPYNHYF